MDKLEKAILFGVILYAILTVVILASASGYI